MNLQKRNTRNLNLKEENNSRFIFWNYCGLLLKSSFNGVLLRLLFFFLSLSNIFFLYHSFPPCALASVRRKGSPSASWRWCRRFYYRPVGVYLISRIAMTGWAMTCVVRRAACASVETCLKTCLELPKSRYLIFSIRRFDAHQWNSSATRESSRVIILKSRFFSTGHSACTSEVRDIFWSSDLCTQWLMTADVLECSLTLRPPQFDDGARPLYYTIAILWTRLSFAW